MDHPEGTYLEPYEVPYVITGWNTLGGGTGQYPSGTAINNADSWSADDYATIGYTIIEDVPAFHRIEAVVDGSMTYPGPENLPPVYLIPNMMRITINATDSVSLFNDGFCIKPLTKMPAKLIPVRQERSFDTLGITSCRLLHFLREPTKKEALW